MTLHLRPVTRQDMIDEAVRRKYPFQLGVVDPYANPVVIKRIWFEDDRRLSHWLCFLIRAEFARIVSGDA